jgi:hypothetical protein
MRPILRGSSPANNLHYAAVYFILSLIILHGTMVLIMLSASYMLAQATRRTNLQAGLTYARD